MHNSKNEKNAEMLQEKVNYGPNILLLYMKIHELYTKFSFKNFVFGSDSFAMFAVLSRDQSSVHFRHRKKLALWLVRNRF